MEFISKSERQAEIEQALKNLQSNSDFQLVIAELESDQEQARDKLLYADSETVLRQKQGELRYLTQLLAKLKL